MYPNIRSFTDGQIPRFIEWVKDGGIFDIYVDAKIYEEVKPLSCAMLIEPRSIQPDVYKYIEQNHNKFRVIFTHDSKTIQLPNARQIYFGGVYPSRSETAKTKNISMCSSNKTMCDLHKQRLEVIKELEKYEGVDTFGTYNGGKFATVDEYLGPYRYSVIMENYIDDLWFTEKICNCFANRTIPIYYGARDITRFFMDKGIFRVDYIEDIYKTVKYLIEFGEYEYETRRKYVEGNRRLVMKYYQCFEDTFYIKHKILLETLDINYTAQRLSRQAEKWTKKG